MAYNFKQGTYEVKNWDKYLGESNPRYLSGYELHVFQYLDRSPHVSAWGAEIVVVPYYSHADDSNRRYMVDIYVEYKTPSGDKRTEIIEIKPSAQTIKPVYKRGQKRSTYMKQLYTFNVNIAKWLAARKFADARGWKFSLLTEKNIFK